MKDAIIFALIVLLVILSLGDEGGPRAFIDGGSPPVALKHDADLPGWKTPDVSQQMLFTPCPVGPRNIPILDERKA